MSMVKAYVAAIASGAKVKNILADTELVSCPTPGGHYHVFGRYATGGGALELTARVAGELCGEDLPINIGDGGPVKPDDHIITLDAAPGDAIIIAIKNTGTPACSSTPSIRIEFEELTAAEIAQIRQSLQGARRRPGR